MGAPFERFLSPSRSFSNIHISVDFVGNSLSHCCATLLVVLWQYLSVTTTTSNCFSLFRLRSTHIHQIPSFCPIFSFSFSLSFLYKQDSNSISCTCTSAHLGSLLLRQFYCRQSILANGIMTAAVASSVSHWHPQLSQQYCQTASIKVVFSHLCLLS